MNVSLGEPSGKIDIVLLKEISNLALEVLDITVVRASF